MASLLSLSLTLTTWMLLLSHHHMVNAQTCKTQTFKNKLYANCTDLPTLKSYLHYTYNSTNSSLSIAFMASPSRPDGWVAWAINPTTMGMVGSQALIAFKSSGTLVVKTYNVSSYSNVTESKLSFDVWDLSAESESSSGNYVIFASVKVAENATEVNQVWQVGPSVGSDGVPAKHDFGKDNLNSKGTLQLVANSTSPGNSGNGSGNSTTGSGKNSGYKASYVEFVNVLVGFFVVFVASLFV